MFIQMLQKTVVLLFFLVTSFSAFSQEISTSSKEIWSLEKCINHARQNNLNLRQSEIAVSQAELTQEGSRKARLPSLNARTSLGFQYGRNVDPTTNDFINTRLGFNNLSLDANMTVYNGGKINNTIKQSQYDLAAVQEDANAQFQNTAIQMSSAYLSILLAKEQVNIAEKALTQSNNQLRQIDKRIDAGTVPKADRLDILAQMARNEQTLITSKNAVAINYLNLKNLLELEPDYNLEIAIPKEVIDINSSVEAFSLGEVYAQALITQPTIKASEARMKSAEIAIPITKADALPNVQLFAQLDSRFSNISNFPNDAYFDQLDKNFGQTIGAQINIPIYNNHRVSINTERARLNIINTEIQNRQIKQQLKADVQNAMTNASAAHAEMDAAVKSLEAAKAANDNAQKKYKLGAINTFELTTSKTNLDTAELNVARAKYDYIFRLKIIDFYLGKAM